MQKQSPIGATCKDHTRARIAAINATLVAAVAAAATAFIAAVTCKDHTRARIAAINATLVAAVSGGLLTEF